MDGESCDRTSVERAVGFDIQPRNVSGFRTLLTKFASGVNCELVKTARLLCRVSVPVTIIDFSWALRLSCRLLRTDDHI